jgi:hypothetical protein
MMAHIGKYSSMLAPGFAVSHPSNPSNLMWHQTDVFGEPFHLVLALLDSVVSHATFAIADRPGQQLSHVLFGISSVSCMVIGGNGYSINVEGF